MVKKIIACNLQVCWTFPSYTLIPYTHSFLKSSINGVRYTSISFSSCLVPAIIIHNIMYFCFTHKKIGHELWPVLKLPKGFIPSEARPSLRFLGSCVKFRYKRSIVFHWGESAGCRSNPSLFLAITWHVKFFCIMIISKQSLKPWNYWKIPAHLCWTVVVCGCIVTTCAILHFVAWYPTCRTFAHFDKLIFVQNAIVRACMYFSSTSYPQDIISSLPFSDFWVTCYLQEAYSSITQAI